MGMSTLVYQNNLLHDNLIIDFAEYKMIQHRCIYICMYVYVYVYIYRNSGKIHLSKFSI